MRALADEDEQLARRIAEIARDHLSNVDPQDIADALYVDLDALGYEEAWGPAGRKCHGDVGPNETAYEVVEGVLKPFLDELGKYQQFGISAETAQLCIGLLLRLYTPERESTSEFKNWATDAPLSFAATVLGAWKEGEFSHTAVLALKTVRHGRTGRMGPGSVERRLAAVERRLQSAPTCRSGASFDGLRQTACGRRVRRVNCSDHSLLARAVGAIIRYGHLWHRTPRFLGNGAPPAR